jgi:tRNA (mo5U34)-methyltransferase
MSHQSPYAAPLPSWETVDAHLGTAEQHARIGTEVPSLTRYRGVTRRLARLAARGLLHVSQVVTNRQRQFNVSMLSSVQALRQRIHELEAHPEPLPESRDAPTDVLPCRPDMAPARAEYARLVQTFDEETRRRGYAHVNKYCWYHTVDLGNGLITPGDYDYRPSLPLFQFPTDMTGMNVLDVGSATGFFAFEFEKRGANVISVELPSIADWDILTGEKAQLLQDLMTFHQLSSVAEEDRVHLEGPFEFCRTMLNSRVKRCHSRADELTAAKLGISSFDLIFVGDVLLHTFSPLKVLDVLASLCRGTLIIAQEMPNIGDGFPLMVYVGGDRRGGDSRSWWLINQECLQQILRRLGFKDVSVVGRHSGVYRRHWEAYDRCILHATR